MQYKNNIVYMAEKNRMIKIGKWNAGALSYHYTINKELL